MKLHHSMKLQKLLLISKLQWHLVRVTSCSISNTLQIMGNRSSRFNLIQFREGINIQHKSNIIKSLCSLQNYIYLCQITLKYLIYLRNEHAQCTTGCIGLLPETTNEVIPIFNTFHYSNLTGSKVKEGVFQGVKNSLLIVIWKKKRLFIFALYFINITNKVCIYTFIYTYKLVFLWLNHYMLKLHIKKKILMLCRPKNDPR